MKDLLFFFTLFKPYKGVLVLGVLLALLTALASISLLTLAGWFITSSAIAGVLAPDGVAFTFNFLQPAAEIRALAIVRTAGRYAERMVTHQATFNVLAEIRCWFFEKLIPLAPGRLLMQRSADVLSRITQDIDALDALYLRLSAPVLVLLLGGTAVILFIAGYSVQVSMIVLAFIMLTAILIPWWFNRLGRELAEKSIALSTEFKIKQLDMLQGMADLIVFDAYKYTKNQLIATSDQLIEAQTNTNHLTALTTALTDFLSQITLLIVIVCGSVLFHQGVLTGAILVMLCFASIAVFELVTPISSAVLLLTKTQESAKRVRALANLDPCIKESEQFCSMPGSGMLQIHNVSFRYSENSNWVLKNINLSIAPGDKIAIVGSSGSGKTTLLHLIMRFFDPEKGYIEYAATNYKQYASDQLMQQFAVLSQRTQLFASTIKENLLLANPGALDSEINQAINRAGLTDYIQRLPDGINTWLGENEAKLSTGEARRIALARVYLKNAPILLLDEPTEGLDQKTEQDVLLALESLSKDKTLIMVTHRIVGLQLVNQIYKMDEGCLKSCQN